MKKALLFFFLTVSFLPVATAQTVQEGDSFGGLSVIDDPDGYVNVREAGPGSQVVYRMEPDEVFGNFGNAGEDMVRVEWATQRYDVQTGTFSPAVTEQRVGNIHASRVKSIGRLPRLEQRSMLDEGRLELRNDILGVVIEAGDFDASKHTIEYGREEQEGQVISIDGEKVWGQDGGMPSTQVSSVKVMNGAQTEIYELPSQALKGIYEPVLADGYTEVFLGPGEIYIVMFNGDGVGGYGVCWVVKDWELKTRSVMWLF